MSGESLYERLTKLSPERLALLALEQQERLEAMEGGPSNDPIAVVGLGCRFPGAPDPDAYWTLLRDGVEAVGEVTPDRWDIDVYYDPDPDVPGRMATRWAGLVDDVDRFDPQFFGISPREARAMDPQQRLLLEVAWHALEHAGIPPDSLAGSATGTYIGACNADYAQMLFGGDGRDLDMYLATGNADSVASGRLSYVLGLQGPALSVDTACSSSLVATHLAVQGLRARDCDLALAGGVNVILSAKTTIALSQAKMMAADGRCKAFDAAADGFVRGEGCGLLVLKRLPDAKRDGDRILAVIRGSAVNQDGRSNGLTAPNGPSQAAVIRAALADGSVEPTEIGYVEAHGTGTSLGDPIEIQAMGTALGADRGPAERLLVGSVKSNIGHLESAAGVAGLIKLVLAMEHGQVPASLHLNEPNPYIPWDRLPIDVNTELRPWPHSGRALAGVSSFGFSGTNAHIIVEPGPAAVPSTPDHAGGDQPSRSRHLLAISAADAETLDTLAERYREFLATGRGSLPDLARMAATARSHHSHRLAVIAGDEAEAVDALAAIGEGDAVVGRVGARRPKVAFLFTGHGSQYPGMGAQLHAEEPVFRDAIERCAQLLATEAGVDLHRVFGPDAPNAPTVAADDDPLETMTMAQPAVFTIEYATAQLWRSWGVTPDVVVGHSVGEYVAAVDAGVMSLADGLRLVATRGRLMDTLPPGAAMATILAPESEVTAMIADAAPQVSVAAVNGPASVAVSGVPAEVEALLRVAKAAGIEVRPLDIPVAAHSPQVEPILDEFERVAATVTYHQPSTTVVSGLTGTVASGDDLVTAGYWRRHLRQPVRFGDAFAAVHDLGARAFIETGPHPTLINMGRHIIDGTPGLDPDALAWLPSLRRGRHDLDVVLGSLGLLYTAGGSIDWPAVVGDRAPVVTGPAYPFRRDRHWAAPPAALEGRRSEHPLVGQRLQSPALTHPVFEAEVAASWPEWFDDHRIHGAAIAPAPALIEMMLAAAVSAGQPAETLVGLDVVAPVVLPDEGTMTLQTLVRSGQQPTVEVVSHDAATDRWVSHATANLITAEAGNPAAVSGPSEPAADPTRLDRSDLTELDGAEFYRHLGRAGLGFGPAFQGITAVWTGQHRALARVEPSEAVAADGSVYGMHPALLDACFHALGAPDEVRDGGDVALLVGIERLVRRGSVTGPVWAEVVLRNGDDLPDDGSIVADLTVLDDDGRALVEATGLHLRLADRHSLRRASGRHLDDLVHEVIWEPIGVGDGPDDPMAALDQVADLARGKLTADEVAAYRSLATDLDRLAMAHVRVALDHLDEAEVTERYRPLYASLTTHLTADRPGTNGHVDETEDAEAVLAALRSRHPEHGIEIDLVDRCGRALAEVMTGRAEPLDLLFPGGDQAAAEHLYRDTPIARAVNAVVADAVAAVTGGRPVRILEVGAGTGATTDAVLDALAPGTATYTMTDVAPTFVARAADRYAGRSEVDCRVLDIERDPGSQGFAPGGHDVVIAANVVHATADVAATVEHLTRLLAPGGHLVLLEAVTPQLWVTTTFGLTEGWWRFRDHELRPDGPLLSADRWIGVLSDAGLVEARALTGDPGGADGDDSDLAGQAVLTARAPQRSEAMADLVIGQPTEWRQRLVDAMAERAGPGATVSTLDRVPDAAALAEHVTSGPAVRRIVVLTDGIDTSAPGPTDPEAAQAEALAASTAVLHAAQAVASAGSDTGSDTNTRIFAITRATQPAGGAAVRQPHLAAVWGLARVVSLEQPESWGAAIDLAPDLASTAVADEPAQVASLIAGSGSEDQYALRGDEILVPRLVPATDPPPAAMSTIRSDGTYLITGGLGGLGLVVADWLADQGASTLVLLGRRGLPDPDSLAEDDHEGHHRLAAVRALRDRGVRVEVVAVDLRDQAALAAVVDRCGDELPPLRGVIHTAAALGERALVDLDVETLDAMLHPKVAGTWALDAVTADAPLDVAVSFSSTTALIGSAGLGHYAAANAVLDAHANAHRSRPDGHPWVSINWGTWDVMRVATDEERATVGRGGLRPIPSAEALDQLGRIVAASPAQIAVVDADWQTLRPLYEARRPRPFLSLLGLSTDDGPGSVTGAAAAEVAAELAAADPGMRPSMLEAFLRAEVAAALELSDPARVGIHQGLFEMGMDSLMSVELKGRIEHGLGLSLPSTLTFNHPTVAELTEHLLTLLPTDTDDRPAEQATPVEPAPMESTPTEAPSPTADDASPDDLDEAELEARLARRLATLRSTSESDA